MTFQESQHPRDDRGRWADKEGSLSKGQLISALQASVRRKKVRDAMSLDHQDKEQALQKRQQIIEKLKKIQQRLAVTEKRSHKAPEGDNLILSAKTHQDFINIGKKFVESIPELGELHRLEKEVGQFYDKDYGEDFETMMADITKVDGIREAQAKIHETLDNTALKIKEKLFAGSPLSSEEAQEAAEKVKVVDLVPKLEKYFRHEKVRKVVANFYQTLGQPINLLSQISTLSISRSNASNYIGQIELESSESQSALTHELSHFVEYDHPEIAMAASLFILSRAEGKAKKLSELIPGIAYRDNEIAIPDKFIHPYVGKVYSPDLVDSRQPGQPVSATEVLSMGLEAIMPLMHGEDTTASRDALSNLVERDFEHFQFVIGALQYVQAKSRQKIPHTGRLAKL